MNTADEQRDDDVADVESEEKSNWKTNWKTLFAFTTTSHLLILVPCLILSTFAGITQPALALFLGRFFDIFSDFGAGKIDEKELMSRGVIDIYGILVIGGATWLLRGAYFTTWLIFGELQAKSVRDELFQSLLEKELSWYEARSSGVESLLSRLQTQIRELQIGTSQPLGFTINYIVQAVASLSLSFYYSWKLTLVVLSGTPLIALILVVISSEMQSNVDGQQIETLKSSRSANNAFANIAAVKCSNSQDQESRCYSLYVQTAAKFYLKLARSNALQIGFIRFATIAMFVQGFYYGGHLVRKGEITPGKVVTTFWSALMATKAFEDIFPHVTVLEKGRGAADALRKVLTSIGQGPKVIKPIREITPLFIDGDIEVRNVSFAYPSRPNHLVLRESTFFFPAGETTFIVGKSGSGKSTLNNLLMRFYKPTSGEIFIDGHPMEQLSTAWLRNNVTLVQQHSRLFNETIFKNIAFGNRDHSRVTADQIQPCLELANLQSTIDDLPSGLQTMVGSGASSLSGGQRQRLAIARARLRDTNVLLLDEITSALDYTSRTSVMQAIRRWRKDRTTIIITHEMSQIEPSDFVYILNDGNVIQEGYHQDISIDIANGLFRYEGEDPDSSLGLSTSQYAASPVSPHAEFDFGWGTSACVNLLGREDLTQNISIDRESAFHEGIDSPAALLERRPSENLDSSLERQPTSHFTRSLSRRISSGARSAYNDMRRQSKTVPSMLTSAYNSLSATAGAHAISRISNRAPRPMSIHQAIAMRSIYNRFPETSKPLPTPEILEISEVADIGVQMKEDVPPPATASNLVPIQRVLATVWPLANYQTKIFLIGGFMSALVHSAVLPIFAFILVELFQTFYIPQQAAKKALIYSLLILGIAIADGLASFLLHYLLEAAGQAWVDNLRNKAVHRILNQPKAWFDDDDQNSPSGLTSSLDRNAEEMRNLVGRFAAFLVVVFSMMTFALIWSFIICWKITLVGLAAAPILYAVTKGFEVVSSTWENRTNTSSEQIGAVFVETFSDIRTVRALTLESYFHQKYTTATSSALMVGMNRAMYSGILFGLSDSAINFTTALIFWFGAHLAKQHEYSVKQILTVFSMLLFSTSNANAIIAYIPQISSSIDTASRLLRLSQLPLKSHEHSGNIRLAPSQLLGPISFINLTYSYASRSEVLVLDRLNLTIPAGICTAIVGASGSGKSTLASLLLGLYPPYTGSGARTTSDGSFGPPSLTLAGHDIRTLHLPTLRNLIAIVPQTPILFPTTVRDNITYGLSLNSALTTQYAVETAARRAGIHDFITSLPQGYDTRVGEGGLGVSGGQAQRIVIARALARRPTVLILDEPTSALDRQSADTVCKSILNLVREGRRNFGGASGGRGDVGTSTKNTEGISSQFYRGGGRRGRAKLREVRGLRGGKGEGGLTVIIITHSREMMACAENVVVMGKGRVLEEGTFEDLMQRRANLWELLGGKGKGNGKGEG